MPALDFFSYLRAYGTSRKKNSIGMNKMCLETDLRPDLKNHDLESQMWGITGKHAL
jgi:hypothetical protein